MLDRREVLKVAGAGMVSMAIPGASYGSPADPTWLSYAINAEQFWKNLPFLERLRKLAQAGFTRYEFSRWKTKDIEAIARANEELGIQAILFTGYSVRSSPKWKEGLIEAIGDAAELAPRLGATRLSVVPPERDEKVDREEQIEDLVDALKEAAAKVAESEVMLILEPVFPAQGRTRPVIGSAEEAAAVIKSVGSPRVRFAFDVRRRFIKEMTEPADQVRTMKDQAGYYRLAEFYVPAAHEEYARALKAIHDAGYTDPIGLGLADRVDPSLAIDAVRKADAAAKAL
jgi:hydroxypyruvate isomerase